MLSSYERVVIIRYLANATQRIAQGSSAASELVEWLGKHCRALGIPVRAMKRLAEKHDFEFEEVSDRYLGACRKLLDKASEKHGSTRPDRLLRRLKRLGKIVGLAPSDTSILEMLLRYSVQPAVEDLIDSLAGCSRWSRGTALNVDSPTIPLLLGVSPDSVRRRLAADAPLVRSGLVAVDDHQEVGAVPRLHGLVFVLDRHLDVRKFLLGNTPAAELEWSDFDHLGQQREDLLRLVDGALQEGAKGVNVLVHGPPGTGKTEFCKVLAKRLGVELVSVGEAVGDGHEPSRSDRLAELRLAQSLLVNDWDSVLLFDEMDDVLSDFDMPFGWGLRSRRRRPNGGYSKIFMNRLLEENQKPTLWTTNTAYDIKDAILRRMIFALEMRLPPPRIRARIWARQLENRNIEATAADTLALAKEFDAPPGVAAGATAAADLGNGGFELVRRSVRSLSRVLGCERPLGSETGEFDCALVEADIDLGTLADRLVNLGKRNFSICLQGPPGTGKSAYARYLADRLGLEVLQKRASDLLSPWVGVAEQNIAQAFAEARDTEAFLIFDEADSLLADRQRAQRSWEVTQVNEMLTWMESHPLPIAFTTNHGQNLDSASLRRFVFKAKLGYLKPASAAAAFGHWFAMEAPPGLGKLDALTPGDFHVVRRKAEVLGSLADGDELLEMLRLECAAKPGQTGAIGFGRMR